MIVAMTRGASLPEDDRFTVERYGNYLDELWGVYGSLAHPEPGELHRVLADRLWPVLTTDVFGTHQRAGSAEVVELSGSLSRSRCMRCKRPLEPTRVCPDCGSHRVRPDVVLAGEDWQKRRLAREYVHDADTVVVFDGTDADWLLSRAKRTVLISDHPSGGFDKIINVSVDEWIAEGAEL